MFKKVKSWMLTVLVKMEMEALTFTKILGLLRINVCEFTYSTQSTTSSIKKIVLTARMNLSMNKMEESVFFIDKSYSNNFI